jgi:hypothetical protein
MRPLSTPLLIVALMLAGTAANAAPVLARGASNVSGDLNLVTEGRRVSVQGELRGLNQGEYRVLLLPRCPPDPRPVELRTGEVPEDRRAGLDRKSIPYAVRRAGSFIANDRDVEVDVSVSRTRVAGWPRVAVAILEGDTVNPPLSGPYGLVACTPYTRF